MLAPTVTPVMSESDAAAKTPAQAWSMHTGERSRALARGRLLDGHGRRARVR
jgi:hypothetical protein